MVKIVLIRPGSTDYDRQGRIQGTLDVPLNAEGSAEVNRAIDELQGIELEAVYASNSEPAVQTAQAIARSRGLKVRKLERLHNVNHGLWQGMLIDEVKLKQPKVYRQWQDTPENICPPEGEMLAQAEARVRAVVNKLLKKHKEGAIGLVVPEPLASLVRRLLNQSELGNLWKAPSEHGRWEVLDVQPAALAQSS
jgi:probable phosphoglycerate mutase